MSSQTFVMSDDVRDTLHQLIQSNSNSNPALNRLIGDYRDYHVVLVVVGGLFVLALLSLSVFCWTRFARAPRSAGRRWTFEKRVNFSFGTVSMIVGLFMALIVTANLSNVLDPRQGFSGTVGMLGSPQRGTRTNELHQAYNTWLQSGSTEMPPVVRSAIDDRLAWQQPKAIICSVLLIAVAWVCARIWRNLITRSRTHEAMRTLKEVALLNAGVATALAGLLLMSMVIGNTQGSVAPVSLTLLYG